VFTRAINENQSQWGVKDCKECVSEKTMEDERDQSNLKRKGWEYFKKNILKIKWKMLGYHGLYPSTTQGAWKKETGHNICNFWAFHKHIKKHTWTEFKNALNW
jgi:hypothetical protein